MFARIKFLKNTKNLDLGKSGSFHINSYSGYYDKRDFKGEYHTSPDYQGELEIVGLDKATRKIKGLFSLNAITQQQTLVRRSPKVNST